MVKFNRGKLIRGKKKTTSLTQRQQRALLRSNVGKRLVKIFTNHNGELLIGYEKGVTITQLCNSLIGKTSNKLDQINDKKTIKDVIKWLRREKGFPIICTRDVDNQGIHRYHIQTRESVQVYCQQLDSIELGITREKKTCKQRTLSTFFQNWI